MNINTGFSTVTKLLLLAVSLFATPAFAHTETGVAGGLISGFLHPIYGLDHLVAMVAVGLWGAQLGKPAIWLLPITFPLVMAFGGVLGVAGFPLPAIEMGIALSALVLGIMVLFSARPPLALAALIVGFFAVFHGYAHGAELPGAANPLAYGVGFVISTGLLHLAGIGLGVLTRWPLGTQAIRGLGGMIAALGVYFSAASAGWM
ncbi:MAG: HupE/UreJ family protein [Pseudomonadota bacterium]|nr:HupE/UreJ family protein [Pseudomonadota bacterium]